MVPHGTRFGRFLLVGGFAAAVNLAARYVLTPLIGFGNSVLLAYLIGMAVAYTLFRIAVFGGSGRGVISESLRFTLVNLLTLGFVYGVSVGLARIVFPAIGLEWHAEDLAHLFGLSLPAITSYIGHSLYTFKDG